MVITFGLWGLIGLAVLLSLASFVAAGGNQMESAGEESAVPGPDVAAVAERAVRTWLTGQPRGQVTDQVVAAEGYGPNDVDAWRIDGLATIQVRAVDEGYWAVVVATSMVDPATAGEGTVGSVEWFLEVGVAETRYGAVVVASPAPVPPPASRTALVEVTSRQLTAVDPNNHRMTAAVDFVAALLTGDEAVSRYTAPGVDVTPALPPGVFTSVRVLRASATDTDEGTLIRLEVVAESPARTRMLFAYTVTVVNRAGRSEVTAFGATPPVTATGNDPHPAAATPTTTTTTTSTTAQVPATSVVESPPPSAPSVSGSGLDGPYEPVDRPGA